MVNQEDLQRRLALEGCANMRDIGGYATQDGRRTRWKVVVRSDNLDKLPPASQQAVIDYGVTTVIDLREPEEVQRQPDVFAASEAVRYLNLPLKGTPEIISGAIDFETREALYLYYLESCQNQICSVLETISSVEDGCALVHCVAGKDRTGLVVALLLGLANVSHEIIAYDYGITGYYLADKIRTWREKLTEAGHDLTRFEREVSCPPDSMRIVMSELEKRYGGAASYLRSISLSDQITAQLRARMVE